MPLVQLSAVQECIIQRYQATKYLDHSVLIVKEAKPIEIDDKVTVNSFVTEAETSHNLTTDSSFHASKDWARLDNQNKIIENQEKILKEVENLSHHKCEQKIANSSNSNGKPESEDTSPFFSKD